MPPEALVFSRHGTVMMGRIPRVFGFDVEKSGARQKVGTPSTISPSLRLGALGALPALPRRKRCAIGRQESLSVRRLVVFLLPTRRVERYSRGGL